MNAARQRKTHDAGVINDDEDYCQRAKEIETGLPLSILKPRIEIAFKCCYRFARHMTKKKYKLRINARRPSRLSIETNSPSLR